MPAPDPRLAIVVATRNRAESLQRTLDELSRLPERPRIVVVDNGSTDETVERTRVCHPAIELIALSENLGAAARNVGAERVDTPYVAFADDDSWWAPGALDRAASALDHHPRLALVAARVLVGEARRLDPTCAAMAGSPIPRPPDAPGPLVLGFLACGAVVRRSAFLGAGGFSRRFGVGGEEALLALDLAAAGWWLCYLDEVVAHHHPSPIRDRAARRRVQIRNALWCAWMRRSSGTALQTTVRMLLQAPGDRDTRAGLLAALSAIRAVLRERQPIPADLEAAVRLLDP